MCGRTVITVLLFTGLQISELAALGLGDLAVSAIEMLVTVRRGKCTDFARPPRTTSTLRRSSTGKRTVRRRQGARLSAGRGGRRQGASSGGYTNELRPVGLSRSSHVGRR